MDFGLRYFYIPIYICGLYFFGLYIQFLDLYENFQKRIFHENDQIQATYDYIIVGCGTAGSIISLRLSEIRNVKILVLEAGILGNPVLDVPLAGPALQLQNVDWQYETVPQRNACSGLRDQRSNWPRGKITGGSNRLNNLIYMRGHPEDYRNLYPDNFAYNFERDILPYFKKSEDQKGKYRNDSKYHDIEGPLVASDLPFVSKLSRLILEAAENLGFPINDLNGDSFTGFMEPQVSVMHGSRYTPYHYLQEKKSKNLQILTKAEVNKILFKSNFEAYAVEFSYLNKNYTISAKSGIVLSAGVVNTPKILFSSGVGPKNDLENSGINSIIDLPVGDNLQDHVTTGLDLILLNTTIGMSLTESLSLSALYDYIFYGRGPLSSPGCEVIGLIDTTCENKSCASKLKPDLQFMVIPTGISLDGGYFFGKTMRISDKSKGYFEKLIGKTTISILPILLHPKSFGTISLRKKQLFIDPNYLSHPYDVDLLVKGIKIIKKLVETEPMQKLGAELNRNHFPGCEAYKFDTDLYWECYIRHLTLTSYHPIGTCKIGDENNKGVVSFEFKVHKTNNLFVSDASVLPTLPSGNINAAVAMIAEKAAETIKFLRFLERDVCHTREVFLHKLFCDEVY